MSDGNRIVKTVDPSTQLVLRNVPQDSSGVVEGITGTIFDQLGITGTVVDLQTITGTVVDQLDLQTITGTVADQLGITGTVVDLQTITGTVEC